MANSKRRCTSCKKYKEADRGIVCAIGFFCDSTCRYDYATKKTQSVLVKSKAIKVKADKSKHRKAKQSIKTEKQWLDELQAIVNKYVRMRDMGQGCISCDKQSDWDGQWHAGHYYSRGHSSSLRFNLHNIHKQCSVCNNHLSGNIGEYTPNLIGKIGQDKFDYLLANKSNVARYDIEWIKRAIKIAKRKVKRLKCNGLQS